MSGQQYVKHGRRQNFSHVCGAREKRLLDRECCLRAPRCHQSMGLGFVHEAGGELDGVVIAELPQLLGCAGVLEENPVDAERIELTGAEVVERVADVTEQLTQLFLVVGDDGSLRRLTF